MRAVNKHIGSSPLGAGFPFLFGGTFIEGTSKPRRGRPRAPFPFLFGGTFIEGFEVSVVQIGANNFPSFSEGLSLRDGTARSGSYRRPVFPFLFGGTFIEGISCGELRTLGSLFPFLFGGTFIEG